MTDERPTVEAGGRVRLGLYVLATALLGWGLVSLYVVAVLSFLVFTLGQHRRIPPPPGLSEYVQPLLAEAAPMLFVAAAWLWRLGGRGRAGARVLRAGAAALFCAGVVGVAPEMAPVLRGEVFDGLWDWLTWIGPAGILVGAWIFSDLRRHSKPR